MRRILFAVLFAALGVAVAEAQITIPNTLVNGNVIQASELNTNFTTLGEKALNRVTGGTVEGNITLNANVTVDGVDISDYLASNVVFSQGNSTAGTPGFSATTDTDTGMYFTGSNAVGLSLGGTSRFLLDSTGLTVWGTTIIDNTGKIPAISSTYFTSLSGANITAIAEANIADGAVFPRLSANESITGKYTFASGANAPLITGAAGGNFLELTSTGGGATSWVHYLNGSSAYVLYNSGDKLVLSSTGALTVTSVQGDHFSSDGTQGMTGSCGSSTTATVKDGLITACS